MKGTILVGTVGQGIMRSSDGGEKWGRVGVGQGIPPDTLVRCLTPHPGQPEVLFAGTDKGILRTDNAGERWWRLDSPMNDQAVWSIAIDSDDPDRMIAGTGTPTPAVVYQSADGGESWQGRSADIAETCPAVGVPRPTAIAIDPTDHSSIWLGLEVDGVRRSRDGGATWSRAAAEITNPDVHNILVTGGVAKKVYILVNNDVWISDDDGQSWRSVGAQFPVHYPRGVNVRPDDPRVVFVTLGDSTPGRTGVIMRTRDAGQSWDSLPLPSQPNSAMWTLGISRSDPDHMVAGTRYGHLFASEDGGDSWTKLWRELSEVSSIALIPD